MFLVLRWQFLQRSEVAEGAVSRNEISPVLSFPLAVLRMRPKLNTSSCVEFSSCPQGLVTVYMSSEILDLIMSVVQQEKSFNRIEVRIVSVMYVAWN